MVSPHSSTQVMSAPPAMSELAALQAEVDQLRRILPNGDVLANEYIVLRLNASEVVSYHAAIISTCDSNGVWTAAISGSRGSYPNILRRGAEHARAEVASGERKTNAVMYTCSHIVLVANGRVPRAIGLQASHLCHETKCLNIDHLVWEYRYDNLRRNRCIGESACICGLQPPCVPTAHGVASSAE